nr:hypothetical protein SYMBAF_50198 [Serratia symbiotica]
MESGLSTLIRSYSPSKIAVFTKKYRLTEIMRPYAGDNREVDGFARKFGVFGSDPAMWLFCPQLCR